MAFFPAASSRIFLLDGAIQCFYEQQNLLQKGDCPAMLNITRPMDVLDAHSAYLAAGADILTANTFSANPLRLKPLGISHRMDEIMQSGVALCKEAASGESRHVYVAASIGPTDELYLSDPEMPSQIYEAFFNYCAAAEQAGADMLLIETMSDIMEARLAILAARTATKLPILCSFTLEEDGCTYAGNPPEILPLLSMKLGASWAGLNCGFGPQKLFDGFSRFAGACPLPTFIRPDARSESENATLSPHAFAEAMAPYLYGGAAAIGGCCCATPAHIQALRSLLDKQPTEARAASQAEEYICSPWRRVPLSELPPQVNEADICNLCGLSEANALDTLSNFHRNQGVFHIDFADWGPEAIASFLFFAISHTRAMPFAFHLHHAKQANAALLAYPGIAAVYAHGDAYRVLKAAVRYGAEVIS